MSSATVGEEITSLLRAALGDGGGSIPFDRSDYLHAFGNVRDALLYSALFTPELVDVEGFVFLKELGVLPQGEWPEVTAGIRAARETSLETLKRYIGSFNWVEVPYLFADGRGSDQDGEVLAQVVAQAWRARLQDQFPDRRFIVRILSPAETGSVVGVSFEQLIE
jgi:hypothetical protein